MKDDRIYLLHIRDAIQHILDYTAAGKDGFLSDRKTQDAVVRNLEIIGEATKRVSPSLKGAHPDISWNPSQACGTNWSTTTSASIFSLYGMWSNGTCLP